MYSPGAPFERLLTACSARVQFFVMPEKGNRSRRRRPRKGFPNRVAGYLDGPTHELVTQAAEMVGESISTFVARAVKERAEAIRKDNKADT
jgi:hypothetical protein